MRADSGGLSVRSKVQHVMKTGVQRVTFRAHDGSGINGQCACAMIRVHGETRKGLIL